MKRVSTWLGGALLAAGLSTAVAGEVYRWVDSNGLVHYGDRPPKGARAERVEPDRLGFGSYSESQEQARAGALSEGGDEDTDDAGRTDRIRQEQCQKARERLEEYRTAARMQIREGEGEARDMTAEERVQAIARAEADVEEFCAEAGE